MASDEANRAKLRRAFEAHYEAVSRYCHRRLDAADANDAAARVFAVAWRKIEDMPAGDEALPWLYAVARYEVGALRRSGRRRRSLQERIDSQVYRPEPGPEVVVVGDAGHSGLIAALETLRSADQEILRLRAYEELTLPEIAEVLGCSIDAAKKRSARAMRRLRRAAGVADGPEFVGPSGVLEGGER